MTSDPYHPDDPQFLLSRSLDEPLTEAERLRLVQALESDATLAESARQLRKLDDMLDRWSAEVPEADWDALHGSILGKLADALADESDQSVDRLLSGWRPESELSEEDFVGKVLDRIRPTKHRGGYWVFRLGVPLAAAAAILLAVTANLWIIPAAPPVEMAPVIQVAIGPSAQVPQLDTMEASGAESVPAGRVVVAFGRSAPLRDSYGAGSTIGFTTVGVSEDGFESEEIPPL